MALITFQQTSFLKLNRLKDPTNLVQGEYALGVNCRVRNGGAEPIQLPTEEVSLPFGSNVQAIYGADKYLLVFIDGKAYYRDYTISSSQFFQVVGFQMDALVDTIYTAIVPASTINFNRKPETSGGVIVSGPVTLTTGVSSTPACIVCQDGVSQPFIIFPDGTSRLAQNYDAWQDDGTREYVPIGKQMLFSGGILYLVCKDSNGRYTQLARSVTGRPLDFMVNIDSDGDKLATEAEGGALSVAYSVDFAEITCIDSVGANDGGFFASTVKNSYLVLPNFTNTIFGEPTFKNQSLFSTGAMNQFSHVDLLGDQALIDFSGIRSFNAILQTRYEGRNSPFSADVQPILGNIVQSIVCATEWDNYGLFSIKSIYGDAVLVYDTLLQSFVSVDSYPNITGAIKQFASIKTLTNRELFFITSENKLYKWGEGQTATAGLYVGEWSPAAQGSELRASILNTIFVDVKESGIVYASSFVDSSKESVLKETVEQTNIVPFSNTALAFPFGVNSKDQVRPVSFNFSSIITGWKMGFYIEWNFKAKLIQTFFQAEIVQQENSTKDQARDFSSLAETIAAINLVTPSTDPIQSNNFGPFLTPLPAAPIVITPPSRLITNSLDTDSIQLSWTNNYVEALTEVYRSMDGVTFNLLTTLVPSVTDYLDDSVSEGRTFYYQVRALYNGNYSDFTLSTAATTYPAAPINLLVTVVSSSSLSLSWNNVSSGGVSNSVQRSTNVNGPFTEVANISPNLNTYTDAGLLSNTTYFYRVVTVGSTGLMGPSSVANNTPLPNIPSAPTLVSAVAQSNQSILIGWTTTDSAIIDNFLVYRDGVLVATLGNGISTYLDTGLAQLTTYTYIVKSRNVAGTSVSSNSLSTITWGLRVVMDVSGNITKLFSPTALAAGSWRISYVGGAYRNSSTGKYALARMVVTYNRTFPSGSPNSSVIFINDNTQFDTQQQVETAFAGLYIDIVQSNSSQGIGVYFEALDGNYLNKVSGFPNPMFELKKLS